MLTIGPVTYHNFGPFEDATVDFSTPGLTVVEGTAISSFGCDANGAGKSFLFDGVSWALFGRCIRERYNGDDVIRIGSESGCCVEVQILSGDCSMQIIRYRKHKQGKNNVILKVNGVDKSRGTNVQTDLEIERILGMDYVSFANSVAFGAREDVKSFFASKDSDKKRILENLLGMEIYGRAEALARGSLRSVGITMQTTESEIFKLKGNLESVEARVVEIEEKMGKRADDAAVDLKLTKHKGVLFALRRYKKKLKQEIDDWTGILQSEKEDQENILNVYRVVLSEYTTQQKDIRDWITKNKESAKQCEGLALAATRKISKMVDMKGKACPTCGQVMSEPVMDQALKTAEVEKGQAEADYETWMTKVAELEDLYAQKELNDRPEYPEFPMITAITNTISSMRNEITGVESELRLTKQAIDQMKREMSEKVDDVNRLLVEARSIEKNIAGLELSLGGAKNTAEKLEFWISAFGNAGLKSFLIEAELPKINEKATMYARRLLGSGTTINMSATRDLKSREGSKEEMSIECVIPGKTDSYAGASRGQKRRLDLSLLLAFRDVVSDRSIKPIKQLFCDELFDGLDDTGIEIIIELLREISDKIPVCLVTHMHGLKGVADRIIKVTHTGDKAVVQIK